jgi:hypothetical protein
MALSALNSIALRSLLETGIVSALGFGSGSWLADSPRAPEGETILVLYGSPFKPTNWVGMWLRALANGALEFGIKAPDPGTGIAGCLSAVSTPRIELPPLGVACLKAAAVIDSEVDGMNFRTA